MPGFATTLVGIGPICDAGFTVTFSDTRVIVRDKENDPVLTGWREQQGPKLWHFNLLPEPQDVPTPTAACRTTSLGAFSAYDMPSVQALVRYYHAAAGFPVRDTWLTYIKAGNYSTWPGLTYRNAAKYCPSADATILGHMTQCRQGVRSTKPRSPPPPRPTPPTDLPDPHDAVSPLPAEPSNEVHIHVRHVSRLYTDDTGRFPVRSRSGNQYVMVAYHCDANVILACPFKTRKDAHRLEAYNTIMTRLRRRGLSTDLQILDNEASEEYKRQIVDDWGGAFQLVPPNMHRRNAAERAIRTFKAHFISILAGTDPNFPRYLWDLLIPQAEMTLNFLRNATLDPSVSAWDFFAGPFNYDATPLGPLGSRVIAHNKPSTRNSWDYRGEEGYSVGVSMQHYRSQRYANARTHSVKTTDTVEFRHHNVTQPDLTPADRLHHGVQALTKALEGAPASAADVQLEAIERLRTAFSRWGRQGPPTPSPAPPTSSTLRTAPARTAGASSKGAAHASPTGPCPTDANGRCATSKGGRADADAT